MRPLSQRAWRRLLFGGLAVGLGTLPVVMTATGRPIPDTTTPETDRSDHHLRDVRVLIGASVTKFRIRAAGGISVHDGSGRRIGSITDDDWIIVAPKSSSSLTIADAVIRDSNCTIRPATEQGLSFSRFRKGTWQKEVEYPGTLRVKPVDKRSIELVNELDVERYVACVVAREVWPTFVPAAIRAQAIAARGYVLYQMRRRANADYDVSATQGSQVYMGLRRDKTGEKAAAATEYTKGIVCTFSDGGTQRLFSTYYSSACGGVSQSAAIFGAADDIPPLAGGVRCDFCRIAPGDTYRWGPVKIKLADLYDRLVKRYPKFKSLKGLRDIEIVERTPHGRLLKLRLVGKSGESRELSAENVRLAAGGDRVRSTFCDIALSENHVTFENGRGFGHGLGLCQWGAQGQALKGKTTAEILRFYYHAIELTRVY